MVGNRIKYRSWQSWDCEYHEEEGIVVDAWTETKGSVKGDVFILIGDVKGKIDSRRIYKVEKNMSEQELLIDMLYELQRISHRIKLVELELQSIKLQLKR